MDFGGLEVRIVISLLPCGPAVVTRPLVIFFISRSGLVLWCCSVEGSNPHPTRQLPTPVHS
jgi:hypothetical protein